MCWQLYAVVLGCLAGLWLHFIPCIWWTCDWGEHDGEGVRGAIWFSTWALTTAYLCWTPLGKAEEGEDPAMPLDHPELVLHTEDMATQARSGKRLPSSLGAAVAEETGQEHRTAVS